jgi:hypothetical protein
MEMIGGGHGKIPFETHLGRLNDPAKAMLLDMRSFVQSLGTNVIEDVRPHRVVYSKTMNFRIFLDVEPSTNSLIMSIRSGRAAPPVILTVTSVAELEAAKKQIADAYQKIQ